MRPDPGSDVLERIHAEMSPAERALIGQRLREDGFLRVWRQVDMAGPMDPVDEGMFILDRLYPAMPSRHRESFRNQMQADFERGTWNGFQRPLDRSEDRVSRLLAPSLSAPRPAPVRRSGAL